MNPLSRSTTKIVKFRCSRRELKYFFVSLAALLWQGRMKLTGTTELGEYSIDLDKVGTVTPLK